MSKRFISLASKITAFSTIVILVIGILITAIVYSFTNNFFVKIAAHNLNNRTYLIANNIENALTKLSNDITLLSKTPPIQGIIRSSFNDGQDVEENSNLNLWKDRLSTIFTSMLEVNPDYTQIRYIGIADNGKEITRVDQVGHEIFRIDDSALQQKRNRHYFQKGINLAQGSILFSKVTFNQERGKLQQPPIPTLRALRPIYTKKQKLFGLLAININFVRYLRKILLSESDNKYDIILFDKHGDFFIYNNKTKTVKFIPPNTTLKHGLFGNSRIKSTNEIIPQLKNDKGRITTLAPIHATKSKDHQVFTVAISVSKSVLLTEDTLLLREILVWVFSICVIACFATYLFSKKMMVPLSKMAKTINESTRFSDVSAELPTQLNDEVGTLARAFEQKTKLLSKLALYDSLSGLPNRKNFLDHFEEAIHRASRKAYSIVVMYIDINDFKTINDTYGHDYGDALLVQFSQTLSRSIRANDFCARLGGDEFAILTEDVPPEELKQLLHRYEKALNTSYGIKGITLNITISGGAALYPEDASTPTTLIEKADQAMYQSKKARDGLFVLHSNLSPKKQNT